MAGRNVDDELSADVIVAIPKDRERALGAAGTMLKPSRASVESLVAEIPAGRVATMPLLRATLARRRGASTTCPFLTKRALMAIAEDAKASAPVWRIVKAGGAMMGVYPGGDADQAARLSAEGVAIAAKADRRVVADLRESLAAL